MKEVLFNKKRYRLEETETHKILHPIEDLQGIVLEFTKDKKIHEKTKEDLRTLSIDMMLEKLFK